jgi:hypothetical protein
MGDRVTLSMRLSWREVATAKKTHKKITQKINHFKFERVKTNRSSVVRKSR